MKHKFVTCYVDGASRGNPGPSGIGVVIQNSRNETVKEIKEYIGERTNNVAEYRAVMRALEEMKNMKVSDIVMNIDSELVVNQLNGDYRTKDENLRDLLLQIRQIEKNFSVVKYNYVPREKNKVADKLANIAINLQGL